MADERSEPDGASEPYSTTTCPSCQGPLSVDSPLTGAVRCAIGHAYSKEDLFAAHGERLEDTVWAAYRLIRERTALCTEMAIDAGDDREMAAHYRNLALDAETRAEAIYAVLVHPTADRT